LENLTADLNNTNAKVLRQNLYNAAMTIATAENDMLPLKACFSSIATVAIDSKGFNEFQSHLEQFFETKKYFFAEETDAVFNAKINEIARHELVIVSLNGMSRHASKNYGLTDATIRFINALQGKTNVIL